MNKNPINQYLNSYAELESQALNYEFGCYDYVIVIPICNESHDCLESIFSQIDKNLSVLVVVVVNSPDSNNCIDFSLNNQKYISNLENISHSNNKIKKHCYLLKFPHLFDTLLIDKNSDGNQLDEKLGVGLARKIGCDIALKLYQKGQVKYPWIFSTDADVILPENYFTHIHSVNQDSSALVLDFEHVGDDEFINKLQFYYDFKIRYYHAGIKYAGSQYDYIPLGSTLIANMDCYAQVRGFPKKDAGEDFYLLNKLAKIKPVKYVTSAGKVKIKARFSNRVPFGTGPALIQIKSLDSVENYMYYHPNCFVLLKQWIKYLESMWNDNHLKIIPPKTQELISLYDFFNCDAVFKKSQKQITSQKRWAQFVHQWFDSFKTLKAIHHFDIILGKLNLMQLLNSSYFAKVNNHSLQTFINNNDKI